MAILKDGIYGELNTAGAKEHPAFWAAVLQHLQTLTTPDLFQVWLKPVEVLSLKDGELTLRVPSLFFQTYLRSNFESKIQNTVALMTGESCRISYLIGTETLPEAAVSPLLGEGMLLPSAPGPSVSFETDELIKTLGGYIETKHSFETFIVGSGTQFAHAAAKGVAMNPGSKHNPLLIYGPSGLGKTHLLHAIAVQILRNNPQARVCYISAEQFVNDCIEAIGKKNMNQFQSRYRSKFDVFLIDDIQFFGGKDRSQEEFFHTFNHLYSTHNQVVMTSDKPPKDLSGLEDRLITRLQQGLVVDVKPPDLETRIAILESKAEADDIYLPEDVCLMIATNIRSNVRELEGALVRLGAEASINGSEITLEMAREALADLLQENKVSHLTIDAINRCVSQYFKISITELNSKSRARKYAEPRQIAMYLCRRYTKKTLPEIASAFGGKDHSTVIHAVNKIEKSLVSSTVLKKQVDDIQQML